MSPQARFLLLVADDNPAPTWAMEAYRSLAGRPDAIALSAADSRARVEQLEDAVGISDFLVADVSSSHPDLYYFCGFAQAQRKPLLLLVQEGHQPHFNLSAYNIHVCSDKEDIETAFESVRCEVQTAIDRFAEESVRDTRESEDRRLERIRASARMLPRLVVRPKLEELLLALEAISLEPELSGLPLDEVPAGRFGYSWGVDLNARIRDHLDNTAPDRTPVAAVGGARKWTLSASQNMSYIGVLKSSDANVFVVCVATVETIVGLRDAPANSEIEIRLFAEFNGSSASAFWARNRKAEVTPIAIPVARIRRLDSRSTREGTVVDVVVDCGELPVDAQA